MSGDKKVWFISSGNYSDYSPNFACPDEATANEIAARMNAIEGDGTYQVESLGMISDLSELQADTTYYVFIDMGGNETSRHQSSNAIFSAERPAESIYAREQSGFRHMPDRVQAHSNRGYDVALKAARDKLAEVKARAVGL